MLPAWFILIYSIYNFKSWESFDSVHRPSSGGALELLHDASLLGDVKVCVWGLSGSVQCVVIKEAHPVQLRLA